MRLTDCSKDELIKIINLMSQRAENGNYHLTRALNQIETERELACLDEADKISALIDKKTQDYKDLLSPYDGKPTMDIPGYIIDEAMALLKEIAVLHEQWSAKMGI